MSTIYADSMLPEDYEAKFVLIATDPRLSDPVFYTHMGQWSVNFAEAKTFDTNWEAQREANRLNRTRSKEWHWTAEPQRELVTAPIGRRTAA